MRKGSLVEWNGHTNVKVAWKQDALCPVEEEHVGLVVAGVFYRAVESGTYVPVGSSISQGSRGS